MLGTLSGARECREGSGGCSRREVVGMRGPNREDLLRKDVDLDTGLRGHSFRDQIIVSSRQAETWNHCFAEGT